jgi:hypothetical protein
MQLLHIFGRTGRKGLLHHRLLGADRSTKGVLQPWISSQPGIDFDQPVCSGQQADKRIHQLVDGRMLDGFLLDLHPGANRTKEIELTQLHSYGRQRSGWAKMLRGVCDRPVSGDAPSHGSEFGLFHEIRVITFLLVLASSSLPRRRRYFGRNLGILNMSWVTHEYLSEFIPIASGIWLSATRRTRLLSPAAK